LIKLEHVGKTYTDGTEAVKDLTMEIKQGEFCVFLGPSGCGKTTSMKMINCYRICHSEHWALSASYCCREHYNRSHSIEVAKAKEAQAGGGVVKLGRDGSKNVH